MNFNREYLLDFIQSSTGVAQPVKDVFCNWLSQVDFSKIDVFSSKCYYDNNSIEPKAIGIDLISTNAQAVKLSVLIWKDVVNLYMGERGCHCVSDAKIASDKAIENFKFFLGEILTSTVVETIKYTKTGKVKAHWCSLVKDGKENPLTKHHFITFSRTANTSKREYAPWVS